MRIKQGFSLLVHMRCFVPVVLRSVLLFLFVIFVSLSLVFFQRRVRVCCRQVEVQEEHRPGESVAGRERADKTESKHSKEWADTGGVQSGGAWCQGT